MHSYIKNNLKKIIKILTLINNIRLNLYKFKIFMNNLLIFLLIIFSKNYI